jgi:hypothetical protein
MTLKQLMIGSVSLLISFTFGGFTIEADAVKPLSSSGYTDVKTGGWGSFLNADC